MHRLGITMGGYVLFGYPGEEWEDIEKTIELIRDIAPVDYSTSVAFPMPGTEFHDLVSDLMHADSRWAEEDPDSVKWQTPFSGGFYRAIESLLHAEYDLGLEFTLKKYLKVKTLRAVLAGMRMAGDDRGRIEKYRVDERFFGWRGLRTAEKTARHRSGHAKKAERLRVIS